MRRPGARERLLQAATDRFVAQGTPSADLSAFGLGARPWQACGRLFGEATTVEYKNKYLRSLRGGLREVCAAAPGSLRAVGAPR